MKKKILDCCINSIKNNSDTKYNEEKLAEIRYGLEAIYLTITKLIIIFIVALIMKIFKEMLTIMILYNLLRITGYGIHAKKSWMCLVSSLILFICCPLLAINITIPTIVRVIICGFCVISFTLFAPADTEKHPLIHKKRRAIYRLVTVITSLIYTFVCLYTKNNFLSNAIVFALLIETALILPISYKIFKLPYNNYRNYVYQNN